MADQKIVTETALQAIASDIKDALNTKADLEATYNLLPTDTASGSIASFTDGADNIPVKSLVSEIVAVESGSGTKSPTNPYTISGFDNGIITRCGKNWIDIANQAISANVSRTIVLGDIYLKAGTYTLSYTLSTNLTVTRNRPLYVLNGSNIYSPLDEKTSGRHSWTFTLLEDATISLRWWVVDNNNAFNLTDFQLEIGDTATTFEAYNGNTYTFTFGQTVYGGHFDNKGNLVVTYAITTIKNNWSMYSSYFYCIFKDKFEPDIGDTGHYLLCSMLPYTGVKQYAVQIPNGTIGQSNNKNIYIVDDSCADINAFHSKYNGATIIYPLANPITLSITSQDIPTLLGENNIFSDTGDVEVVYRADIGLYIDKKLNP